MCFHTLTMASTGELRQQAYQYLETVYQLAPQLEADY